MTLDHAGALRNLPAHRIVRAIADAAARWHDADFPPRVRATRAIMERLSYTEPVVDYALDALFGPISSAALEAAIVSELGSLEALDGFVRRAADTAVFARGVAKVAVISSDTTIGVALAPALFALCAKADVTIKDRSDQLLGAFAQTLIQEEPSFTTALQARPWTTTHDVLAGVADADAVVAFGKDDALLAIRAVCKPDARFIPFGHRTSVGYVPRTVLTDESTALAHARDAARDALLYDGQGCLSLHALFVEDGAPIAPDLFARLVARACDEVAVEFPPGSVSLSASAGAYRERMRFRAAQGEGAVYDGEPWPHLVVFDPPRDEPPPLTARTLGIYPVHEPGELPAYVRAQGLPLEAIALPEDACASHAAIFAAAGAARIARLGRLQQPPLAGNHGGQERIRPFISFVYRDDG
jgi:hypothetical protein